MSQVQARRSAGIKAATLAKPTRAQQGSPGVPQLLEDPQSHAVWCKQNARQLQQPVGAPALPHREGQRQGAAPIGLSSPHQLTPLPNRQQAGMQTRRTAAAGPNLQSRAQRPVIASQPGISNTQQLGAFTRSPAPTRAAARPVQGASPTPWHGGYKAAVPQLAAGAAQQAGLPSKPASMAQNAVRPQRQVLPPEPVYGPRAAPRPAPPATYSAPQLPGSSQAAARPQSSPHSGHTHLPAARGLAFGLPLHAQLCSMCSRPAVPTHADGPALGIPVDMRAGTAPGWLQQPVAWRPSGQTLAGASQGYALARQQLAHSAATLPYSRPEPEPAPVQVR